MIKNNQGSLQKAREYVFLLLKFRQRSSKEIYLRLKKKKFEEQVIKQTIDFLRGKGFIDDRVFAKAWISSRLKKSLGLRRIRQELDLKGIDKEIIDSQIGAIRGEYSEEAIVAEIARERLSRLKGVQPDIARRRLYAYLLRRGFSPEIVIDTLTSLCKRAS